jgi:flagellar hook-length control protein FliK
MIPNGISLTGEVFLDGLINRAPGDRENAENAAFAALLILMLAAPAPTPSTGTAESTMTTAAEERGASADACAAAGTPAMSGARYDPSAHHSREDLNSEMTVPLELSNRTAFTWATVVSQSILQGAELPLPTEKIPAAIKSGKAENSVAVGQPGDNCSSSDDRLPKAHTTASIMVPLPEGAFPLANPLPPNLTTSASKQTSDQVIIIENENASKELARVARSELVEGELQKPALASDGNDTPYRTLARSEDKVADLSESVKTVREMIYTRKGVENSPLTARAEAINLSELELKQIKHSTLDTDAEPNSRVRPEITEMVRELGSSIGGQVKEGFSFQQNDRTQSNESFQIATENRNETATRDTAAFQVARASDSVPTETARHSQRIDWHPVIDAVVGEISGRIRVGKQEAILQLDPPELGKVLIEILMDGDKLAALILTETQESRTLIEAHLPELQQALSDDRVDLVDVRVDSGSWSGQRGTGQNAQQEAGSGRHAVHAFANSGNSQGHEPPRPTSIITDAGRVSMWA